jgi:hypothetical protein
MENFFMLHGRITSDDSPRAAIPFRAQPILVALRLERENSELHHKASRAIVRRASTRTRNPWFNQS